MPELAIIHASAAKLHQELAIVIKLLHIGIAIISNVDIPNCIRGNADRSQQSISCRRKSYL